MILDLRGTGSTQWEQNAANPRAVVIAGSRQCREQDSLLKPSTAVYPIVGALKLCKRRSGLERMPYFCEDKNFCGK